MRATDEPRYPTVHVHVSDKDADVASGWLWDHGATGVEERDRTTIESAGGQHAVTLIAHFAEESRATEAMAALDGRWSCRFVHIIGDDWRDGWKKFFKPTRIGTRLVVRPSWEPFEPGPEDIVIVLDPGQAFGTGTHETTQLVLEELENRVHGGERVLDVGCGSGILSIAALLLGAERATAIDIDPIAARVTLENASENAVEVQASDRPLETIEGAFELVLANIRGPILVPMAARLIARVAPGGSLILSGLLAGEEDEVRAAYDPLAECAARRSAGDWLALRYERDR